MASTATTGDVPMQDQAKTFVANPMTIQQEDAIIHSRITNDEKALRRVTKKFHQYASVAYTPIVPSTSATTSVDDARDAFLVELASFHLSLKKSLMVCEAEARQVEEYQRERGRIANEHEKLRGEIETLKSELEHAQLQRKRKMEYDVIAEKINALPSRDELEQSIKALENDMAAILSENEDQHRTAHSQKIKLDMIVADLSELRLMGKQDVTTISPVEGEESRATSPLETGTVREGSGETGDVEMREESGEVKEDAGSEDEEDIPLSKRNTPSTPGINLNPSAKPFVPTTTRTSTPLLSGTGRGDTGTPRSTNEDDGQKEEGEEEEGDDIEMAELEEGEASDLSSELSEPPED
ncbi:hypothetical protein ABKN59_001348 [Abortiporus biennis]